MLFCRDHAISVCTGASAFLDKSILEENIDSTVFQNSSDCHMYSHVYESNGVSEPSLSATATYTTIHSITGNVVATSTSSSEALGSTTTATATATVTVALSTKVLSPTLKSSSYRVLPSASVEEASKSHLKDTAKGHSPVLILRPNLEANETSSNASNEELEDRFNISLVFTFIAVTFIGGLISIGTGLILWRLRRRKSLQYDQVWEADQEPETKNLETQYLTAPTLSSDRQPRTSHEIFVLEVC
ncbi:hypothetical protein K493DRAFT_48368 [Basidiobolus meristosporus CBS 931.73]|uniref:Uncharacterized protein n=1 Tax=Basidiobolus meristosporus CBS 931.73 TaxID=1314790 RepID=A0A1Y1Y1I6_9FUNG|nr:hypothetical protein K493DRAFT_48368 [Basidiobolus meristosporus CBS 931.73]|eukprot:ORX91755.1 hypothetical protein K493DRAFT_48368 [Basidiobolus meristosporus CBS 931.73]